MDDNKIIALYNERNENAIKETETKYGLLLNKIAFEILNSFPDSEECVNTTYLKTWNAIPPTVPKSLRSFICRIARNTALTLLTKLNRHRAEDIYEELETMMADAETPQSAVEGKELAVFINNFLSTQKKRNRQLFVLRYYYNMSVKSLSDCFGMSEQGVCSSLFRMRENLKSFLKEKGITL